MARSAPAYKRRQQRGFDHGWNTEFHFWHAKDSRIRRNAQIARYGQLKATTQRISLNAGDHWNWQFTQGLAATMKKCDEGSRGIRMKRCHLVDVCAADERLVSRSSDDYARFAGKANPRNGNKSFISALFVLSLWGLLIVMVAIRLPRSRSSRWTRTFGCSVCVIPISPFYALRSPSATVPPRTIASATAENYGVAVAYVLACLWQPFSSYVTSILIATTSTSQSIRIAL